MKRSAILFLLQVALCIPLLAQSWPEASAEARAGVRWWWLGSALNDADMRWSLQEYARAGIGTVEITPIYGVQGNEANELSFLSPPWMKMLHDVEQEAQADGILVDMNCGTGWPFGGPLTPIDEAACKAVFLIDTVATGDSPSRQLDGKERPYAQLLCERRYPLGGHREQVIQLYQSRTQQMVKRAAPGGEGYVIDHFDRQAVRHYLERFDHAFAQSGTPLPHSFFNDSYEVYGANWTPTLLREFRQRRGYALEERLRELLGLVDDGNQVLSDYRETLSDLLLENFTQQWTAWAHSHNSLTRNQAHGSPANLLDVYAAVDIPEIEGFGLSVLGIKGLRTDDGFTRRNDSDVSMLKYASSAAHVTGKRFTSSETFTWLTEHFRTSLSQMKPDLDLMFTCGVNRMFFHGTCYSPPSAPWPGWKFYASVDMSPTNSIWRDAPYLMQYIERCQSFLQMGQPDNDFLVYLPVRDMWRQRLAPGERGLLMQFDIHSMARKAPRFISSIRRIDSLGYDCDYISDRQLQRVRVVDGALVTEGGTRYRGLIIPSGTTLSPELERLLSGLAPFVVYGEDETGMSRLAVAEPMRTRLHLRAIRRRNEVGYHYFIANLTPDDVDAFIPLAVPFASVTWFNPMDGSTAPALVAGGAIRIRLRSGESRILVVSPNAPAKDDIAAPAQPLPASGESAGAFIDLTNRPWTLSFLESAPRVERTFRLSRLQTWETLDDDSARVTMGTGVYTTTFAMKRCDLSGGSWMLELGDVRESARVYLNGQFLGCAWAVPFSLPCRDALKAGRNTLRIEVTNLPANRIAHLDRMDVPWRRMKEINVVDINYRPTKYVRWTPVPSGLNSEVRLVRSGDSILAR
ncbi:MAG: glycosyl hydrolase family 2 [Bacteroidaceae bacterium]|nr:glycosyl hydrolase family 2 [Bacteroidaceae bacterium]